MTLPTYCNNQKHKGSYINPIFLLKFIYNDLNLRPKTENIVNYLLVLITYRKVSNAKEWYKYQPLSKLRQFL